MKINCIVLDDEPYALKLIEDYASKIPKLNILFAGSDVYAAIKVLNDETIDLIFLDIQMPQITGIELMKLFNEKHNFIIISAYPEFALDSYRFHVIDFLLKPVTFHRFYQSVEKYIRWQKTFQNAKTTDFLMVKADRKYYKIAFDSILHIEGMKDYIRIHTNSDKIMVLENMKDILAQLPTNQFVRIHRSHIISLNKIKVIEGNRIQMTNDIVLPIGETYRTHIHEWIKNK